MQVPVHEFQYGLGILAALFFGLGILAGLALISGHKTYNLLYMRTH